MYNIHKQQVSCLHVLHLELVTWVRWRLGLESWKLARKIYCLGCSELKHHPEVLIATLPALPAEYAAMEQRFAPRPRTRKMIGALSHPIFPSSDGTLLYRFPFFTSVLERQLGGIQTLQAPSAWLICCCN